MISQAGPLLSSHLEALSSNCRALQNFRFIGFKVEDTNILKNVRKDFKSLKALDICMYDCDEESSSSDDDDDEEESGVGGRSNIEVVLFFMESAVNLEVRTLNFENLTIFFTGREAAHELWEPPQLRLPHLPPGQEPLATHFPSSYFKVGLSS